MRQIVALIILTCFLFSCASKKIDRRKSKLHTKIGTSSLKTGNIPNAFRNLFLAVEYDPDNSVAHNNLALAYFARKKNKKSLEHFNLALSISPKYTDAMNNKGRLLISMKKYPEAINNLEQAAKDLTYPVPERVLTNLSQAYFKNKNWTMAEFKSKQAIELNRKYCPPYIYYGRSLFEQNKYNESAKILDQTLELCKKLKIVSAYYFSGMSYFKLGDLSKAKARMTEVIQRFPKSKYYSKADELLKMME